MSEKATFWLGIDCGGTYLKAGLYDAKGHEQGELTGNRCRQYRHCRVTPNAICTNCGNSASRPSPGC